MLERLTQLENNFSLLLSRANIEPYASLEEALRAPSRFTRPVTVKVIFIFKKNIKILDI